MSQQSKVSMLTLFLCFSVLFVSANCKQHEVGGEQGWKSPNSKHNLQPFNQWASQNRFIVGDTIHFKYEKDSVVEVSEEEYEKCESNHPLFFSNNGDTVFELKNSGSYFFISGISGHCEKGQKMIIKVLKSHHHHDRDHHGPAPAPAPASTDKDTSRAACVSSIALLVVFSVLVSFVGIEFFA